MKHRFFIGALLFIIAALILAAGYLLGAGKSPGLRPPALETTSDISAHTVVKEALPIGEYASLAYRYTSVVKDVSAKDLNGWTIPFTTRKYIFTYDGIMKLGIDASQILVEETPPTGAGDTKSGPPEIRVILPSVKILSHEIIDDSIEVFDQSQTIFNQIKVDEAFRVTADRKREMEEKALASDAVDDAKASLAQQLGGLLGGLPGVKDKYSVTLLWREDIPSGDGGAPAPSP
ncbi:MAG: DUF4230 domain-containing protein [Treponema sp.]|nr:DUF4230 domain-containing protein [Treponema sp.]